VKLALGTAQFGLTYGIANKSGQVSPDDIAQILDIARAAGVVTLDTAVAYGQAEVRLGQAGIAGFEVVTKLPHLIAGNRVEATVAESLARLRIDKLRAVMLHRSSDLLDVGGATVFRSLAKLREAGVIRKIGVSIYDPGELAAVLARYELDLVQAPYNVLDRRLASTGWLTQLDGRGIEVHTRSAFLQGLLVMPPGERPMSFAPWSSKLALWDRFVASTGLPAINAALAFACGNKAVSRVVVGIDSPQQLREILSAYKMPTSTPSDELASDDLRLINPSNWNSL